MVNEFFRSIDFYLVNLFIDLSKRTIKFTTNGDGIGTYDIFQYQITHSPDKHDYLTIGEFSDSDHINERLEKRHRK
jgi:hypothetical protein